MIFEYYFLLAISFHFDGYLILRNLFSRYFNPAARPGFSTFNLRAKDRSNLGSSKNPLVKAFHCPPSSHTQSNLGKLPTVPRIAAFNSRSQSRAMLGCVARKNAKNSFFLLLNFECFSYFLVDLLFFLIIKCSLRSQTFNPNAAIKGAGI